MRSFPAGETLTLHRLKPRVVGGERQTDAYGVLIMDSTDVTLAGCAVWPLSSSEVQQNNQRSRSAYSVALPQGTTIDAQDRLTWRGMLYEVEGEPECFQSPLTGTQGPQVVTMYRVEG